MHTVKDHLARLLATEDLVVEHRQVDTAAFDVERRVLTLPVWDKAESVVIDLLISHEVGHALYTPNDWSFEGQVPMQFVNIVEDIRIEKLMKRRYAGLAKTFYKGYSILSDKDFFGIGDDDISTFNLADKLNLYFKIGNYINVPFDEEEKEFVKRADRLETFDEVIAFAKELYEFCTEKVKQEQEKVDDLQNPPQSSDGGGSAEGQSPSPQSSRGEGAEGDEEEGEDETEEKVEGDGPGRNEGEEDPVEAKTADTFEQALEQLVNHSRTNTTYLELPDSIEDVVVSNRDCQNLLSEYYADRNCIWVDDEYRKYKSNVLKEVNYLVKEFECKKAADSYARSSTARTGVLDCTKLHTYKYNEDLFKKITVTPEGKNHGLIFNLDWSGSMGDCIFETTKQLLTLVQFCRKVGIAYDVYVFTDCYHKEEYDLDEIGEDHKILVRNFRMVNVLTSRVNNKTHEEHARNLFRLAGNWGPVHSPGGPYQFTLSGTPLNEAMIAMNTLIPEFKERTGAQKVHVINLTDGEGYPVCYMKKVKRYNGDGYTYIRSRINHDTFLRDRKTGKTYEFDGSYDQTNVFISQLRDRFPECEFMNIRLLSNGEWSRFKRQCLGYNYSEFEKADAQWRKNKTYICLSSYYTIQYAMHVNALSADSSFEVSEDASKSQIRTAFKKSLGAKKTNKKILSSFIERIA